MLQVINGELINNIVFFLVVESDSLIWISLTIDPEAIHFMVLWLG